VIEQAFVPRLAVGPIAGSAVFVLLAGARLPRFHAVAPSRALGFRWLGFGWKAAVEEVVWRGLVLGGLLVAVGPIAALAFSSVGFALWHRHALGRRCSVHLVTGAAFGAAFLAGGLVAAVLAHATYNVLVDWAVHTERARPRGP
jgi:membrane protease YdiL (CAAX protease family)